MSAAVCPWPGFRPVTNPRALRRAALQLAQHFTDDGPMRLDLSDAQVAEYVAAEQVHADRQREHAAHLAQTHRKTAAGHAESAERLAARATELEDQAAPTALHLGYADGHPAITETKSPTDRPAERLTLDQAAEHLGLTPQVAVLEMGVSGVLADADGGYVTADVERLADER